MEYSFELFWQLVQNNAEHIKILNSEMGSVLQRLSCMETNIKWLNWGVRGIIFGVIVTVGLGILNLYFTRRNGKK